MPSGTISAVIPITAARRAEFVILSLAPPGAPRIPFGILLLDTAEGSLLWKFREDLDDLPLTPEDAEYVSYLNGDFRSRTAVLSGIALLESLEDSLSGFLRISPREAVAGRNFPNLLNRLFQQNVLPPRIEHYVTHLPFYGLRAAATKFGEDMEVSEHDMEWVPLPPGLRPSHDLFFVQVVGRSMEPLIPDGSLTVFRRIRPGSRQGKRLLIEELGDTGSSARFTVKRYTSTKRQTGEDEWAHAIIRLEPLNPEFPAFELDPEAFEGKYRVLGEFVQVLPSPDPDE
jgi:SOS-response transcriptional repressor LexA